MQKDYPNLVPPSELSKLVYDAATIVGVSQVESEWYPTERFFFEDSIKTVDAYTRIDPTILKNSDIN